MAKNERVKEQDPKAPGKAPEEEPQVVPVVETPEDASADKVAEDEPQKAPVKETQDAPVENPPVEDAPVADSAHTNEAPDTGGPNFTSTLSEAQKRGYLGGSDPEEKFAEEERARRIRAGMVGDA